LGSTINLPNISFSSPDRLTKPLFAYNKFQKTNNDQSDWAKLFNSFSSFDNLLFNNNLNQTTVSTQLAQLPPLCRPACRSLPTLGGSCEAERTNGALESRNPS